MLIRLLQHPAMRGLDPDAPETTERRREIVRTKPFLRSVFEEWYSLIEDRLPNGLDPVLELGSGGGFLSEVVPGVITSDVFPVPGVDRVVDARSLPFADGELRAIVMTNVFHHIPDVSLFFDEAQRVLRPGGRVVMVEPWNTWWSRLVHRVFHHETMSPEAEQWPFVSSGPVSGANAALPWIVFVRDQDRWAEKWPALHLVELARLMPFSYLLSGGVSLRSLQPGWMYGFWRRFEQATGVESPMALFALLVVERS